MTLAESVQSWLDESKEKIIANYERDNMRASGSFAQSLKTNVTESPSRVIGVMVGAHHSLFVDKGRGPTGTGTSGAVSLRVQIEKWIEDKNINPQGDISKKSLAFLIARKIHREGWKPKNSYPNGVISSVINESEINKLLVSLAKVSASNVKTEIWQALA